MRVAHQILSGEVAGGQQVALSLAQAARDAGHEALFVSPLAGPFVERAAAEGFETRIVPLRDAYRLDDALRLARSLRAARVELLHTHAHFSVNVLARLGGRLAGIPVVSHMHTENVFRGTDAVRRAQVAVDDATARLCARILVVSDATRRALEAQGYPGRLLETVHTGIEPGAPLDPDPALRAELGEPLVVCVGRLSETKGHLDLVRALARLERSDVHVALVGEDVETGGAFTRALEREAERLGVRDRVVLTGRRGDVPALLAAAHVVALPSWVEGLPVVVLEAMAQARPVVATAVGGVPELVADGETGLLVPPHDVDALARALDELLADPTRAAALGAAGRRRLEERFTLERMAGRVLTVYEEVLR